ncbi:MAG: dihydrolipoyl dehydrogenase [Leptospiraceae bacterium]|nr:dihydrolipoyl dehydrogenase [Leptospiraceae bacterium]MDW8306461.1 dihydrolipoyl dehydrogenase [Leptospiraceae bacterium]
MEKFDVIVIGGGPGGYVAAIRAAQLKLKTAIIDKRESLGGTCLNVGCIPSKALLDSSEQYEAVQKSLSAHGILVEKYHLDLKKLMERKENVVREVTQGIDFLMKKNKIARYTGVAHLKGFHEVEITPRTGEKETIYGQNIVIATGSVPMSLPFLPFDGERIISSDEALSLQKVPSSMIIIGAGVIGVELGSVWRRLGAKVTLVEVLDRLFPSCDRQIADLALRLYQKQGLEFYLEHRVVSGEKTKDGVKLKIQGKSGEEKELAGEIVLVAVGRKPYTEGLGAQELGIIVAANGKIQVNDRYQTNIPHIYAIGDVIEGPMLAHKAEDEGIAVAEIIAGQKGHVNYEAIPYIVYTHPEVAWVGRGEEELQRQGIAYQVGRSFFKANGRAKAMNEMEGMVKLISEKKSDRLLGAFVVGPRASELIAELALAFEFYASAEDIARSVHAHPTLAEVIRDAAQAVGNWAIHQ